MARFCLPNRLVVCMLYVRMLFKNVLSKSHSRLAWGSFVELFGRISGKATQGFDRYRKKLRRGFEREELDESFRQRLGRRDSYRAGPEKTRVGTLAHKSTP